MIGLLHDASIVIWPGRTFLRRLIDLLKSSNCRPSGAFIRLNREARSDIIWWHTFISDWNGLSMMQSQRQANPILTSLHRVHGAVVHIGIPIGSSTSGQYTPSPTASQQKSCCQLFLQPLYGGMHGQASQFYATVITRRW